MSLLTMRLSGSIRSLLIAATILLLAVITTSSRLLAGDAPSPSVTGPIEIGTLGGGYSHATAMNASGQMVGVSTPACECTGHAFSWTEAGGMVDLGALLPAANTSGSTTQVTAPSACTGSAPA